MAAPETVIAEQAKAIFDSEFTTEGFVAAHDKLLRAAGMDGEAHAAVSVNNARADNRVASQLNVEVLIQLYLGFDPNPDPNRVVDPRVIQGYGDRLRAAFDPQATSGTTSDMWYFTVRDIDYPDDPTGNKSRLEATLIGYADNLSARP